MDYVKANLVKQKQEMENKRNERIARANDLYRRAREEEERIAELNDGVTSLQIAIDNLEDYKQITNKSTMAEKMIIA